MKNIQNLAAAFVAAAGVLLASERGNASQTLPSDANSAVNVTAQCLDINGNVAGSLSRDGRSGVLEVPVKGAFPGISYRGTIDHIEFVDVHSAGAAGNSGTTHGRYFVPLDPDAAALVVTLLPENNKMVCRVPDRGPP
jgi:hypothetical protein